ncbi:MBL fold metallo-hydrolase [Pirellulaceae bacterium]|nr:MBL fold metallo-hydrolase [Pirellulaceae bacterium]
MDFASPYPALKKQNQTINMEVISLQSGSNGNSFYVSVAGKQFLFDAGISGSVAEKRLALHGKDIRDIDGLFISHAHRDHCSAMGVFHRKYGHTLFITERTLNLARREHKLGVINKFQFFRSGETIDFGDVQVHTVPTPHDADDSVAFIIENQERRIGILTDIGHAFDGLCDILKLLDAVVIESNYCPEMLRTSRYPIWLKRRVSGKGGHLSNEDSANAIRDSNAKLQWACLCHLSQENNEPDLAIETHRRILGDDLPLHIASRHDVGDILTLDYDVASRGPWKAQIKETQVDESKQLSLF